jgi:alkyl hydroperoxide reductase subunit AhpF
MMREGVKSTFHDNRIWTDLADGRTMVARANVCATGVEWRHLNLPNEDELRGRGLNYGAGVSEAPLCAGEDVYVVGGGNSAGQAVMHLARHARSVTMLVRDKALAASMSQYLSDRILCAANVQVQYDVESPTWTAGGPSSASESARARQRKPTGRQHRGCSSPSAAFPTPIGPLIPPSSAIKAAISSLVPTS